MTVLAGPEQVTHSAAIYRALELPVLRDRHGQVASFNPDELLYMEDGACREYEPELFDTDTHRGKTAMRGQVTVMGREMSKRAAIELAKSICGLCPVLDECQAYVAMYPQNEGVWAGTIPEQRRRA